MENEKTSPGFEIIRETWLSRKPRMSALFVATVSTFALALLSLFHEINLFGLHDWMEASRHDVFVKHEYWRLFTTIFAHADAGHLLSNSLLFFILGFFLYGYFGAWLFPVAAILGGALTNYIVLPTYDADIRLIGASGVVYWMGGAWLVLYFFLSKQKNLTQRFLRSLGVAILLFMPGETFVPNVSYRTHLVGFLVGMGSGLIQYLTYRSVYLAAEVHDWVVEEPDVDFESSEQQAQHPTADIHAFDAGLDSIYDDENAASDAAVASQTALGPASRRSH